MSARQLTLLATAFLPEQFPDPVGRELVMVGRSNVGKSSLINQLAGNKSDVKARVSQKPGCTRSINFYRWEQGIVMADLPGYGYAPLPPQQRQKLKILVDSYFRSRPIGLVVHLVDARLPLQPIDEQLIRWVQDFNHPYLLTLNKCDKLSRLLLIKREQTTLSYIKKHLPAAKWVAVSAKSGMGIPEMKKKIMEFFQTQPHWRPGEPATKEILEEERGRL